MESCASAFEQADVDTYSQLTGTAKVKPQILLR